MYGFLPLFPSPAIPNPSSKMSILLLNYPSHPPYLSILVTTILPKPPSPLSRKITASLLIRLPLLCPFPSNLMFISEWSFQNVDLVILPSCLQLVITYFAFEIQTELVNMVFSPFHIWPLPIPQPYSSVLQSQELSEPVDCIRLSPVTGLCPCWHLCLEHSVLCSSLNLYFYFISLFKGHFFWEPILTSLNRFILLSHPIVPY